jgi:hypothetical protein
MSAQNLSVAGEIWPIKNKLTFYKALNLIRKIETIPWHQSCHESKFDAIYPEVLICFEASGSD